MKYIPADPNDLWELAPEELKAMCRVINALIDFCEHGERHAREDDRFDRDELGIAPEEDYEDEMEE